MDELIPIFGILLVMVPVAGVTAILTLRLGLKPLIESLSAEGRRPVAPAGALEEALHDLSERVESLSQQVSRLEESRDFDRKLLEGAARRD